MSESIATDSADAIEGNTVQRRRRRGRVSTAARLVVGASIVYLLVAYLLVPAGWGRYEKHHPALDDAPRLTRTSRGIPGDPLNIAFVGSEEDLHLALLAAGWVPADPITLKSSIRIAAGTVFRRAYTDAPVSNLFLFGRKQDFAFEQPVGRDPRQRHHVRFWRSDRRDANGQPLWFGAATFDIKVGFSRTTGQITHHIDADVDAERDKLLNDVRRAGDVSQIYWIDGFQDKMNGKNGGGDRYETDGRLAVGILDLRKKYTEKP